MFGHEHHQVLDDSSTSPKEQPHLCSGPAAVELAAKALYHQGTGRSRIPWGTCPACRIHLYHIGVWHCVGRLRKAHCMHKASSALGLNLCVTERTAIAASP